MEGIKGPARRCLLTLERMGWCSKHPFTFTDDRGYVIKLEEHSPKMMELLLREGNARFHERRMASRLSALEDVDGAMGAKDIGQDVADAWEEGHRPLLHRRACYGVVHHLCSPGCKKVSYHGKTLIKAVSALSCWTTQKQRKCGV